MITRVCDEDGARMGQKITANLHELTYIIHGSLR